LSYGDCRLKSLSESNGVKQAKIPTGVARVSGNRSNAQRFTLGDQLGEVDVLRKTLLPGFLHEANQYSAFGRAALAAEQHDQAVMRLSLSQGDKIVATARDHDQAMRDGKSQNVAVGRRAG